MENINKSILTLSVVIGDSCNADCKFCISKLSKGQYRQCPYWWEKLEKACMVAKRGGADTVIITGKAEPTSASLDYIEDVIRVCSKHFPIIELQTNGIKLVEPNYLLKLAEVGLTTLAISCVSTDDQEQNYKMISPEYPNLREVVTEAQSLGLLTRACYVMTKDVFFPPEHEYIGDGEMGAEWFIKNENHIMREITAAKTIGFDQVTLRIMGTPDVSFLKKTKKANKVVKWIEDHKIPPGGLKEIMFTLDGYPILKEFPWGSRVYSVEGTSVCISNCLSDQVENDYRYVIYFPDGHLRYRWEVPEALIF